MNDSQFFLLDDDDFKQLDSPIELPLDFLTSDTFITYEDFIYGNQFIRCIAETVHTLAQRKMNFEHLALREQNRQKSNEESPLHIDSSNSKANRFYSVEKNKSSRLELKIEANKFKKKIGKASIKPGLVTISKMIKHYIASRDSIW